MTPPFGAPDIVRVGALDDLFEAAETLALARPVKGPRLAIITNGGGAGILAVDALSGGNGRLAELSAGTLAKLDQELPKCWSHGNPVDIIGDAPGARYGAAIAAVAEDPGVDALLVMNCPTAVASSVEAADAVIAAVGLAAAASKPALACWLGHQAGAEARRRLSAAGVPTFQTPEQAIDGFTDLLEFQARKAQLAEVGEASLPKPEPDRAAAAHLLGGALERGLEWLDEIDGKALLAAYGIPVVETIHAATPHDVGQIAQGINAPLAVKIWSPDILHKSDIGGVALNLDSPWKARAEAEAMLERIRALRPDARIEGFAVQEMIRRPGAIELIAGIACDPTFGPTIIFGQGGAAVAEIDDSAVGLPPLTPLLAADLVARTRIVRQLKGFKIALPPIWRRSAMCWSVWRCWRATIRKSPNSTSIHCWPTRPA